MAIKRPIKMLLYAAPGVGKSVFLSKFPKPFFICSDGNYEWLEDFGADPNAHADISTYAEFEKLCLTSNFDGYDTIVVDLIEDVYKWNEFEFCKKNGVDHLSDAGGYGKGWDITRTRLFAACAKLISKPKNIVFLSHESVQVKKDKRGNESNYYTPSNMMSEKFLTMLEGRLRYVLHAFLKEEVKQDGKIIQHRILSLVPGVDEYGIIRGVDTTLMPNEIPLDAPTFLEAIGYESSSVETVEAAPAPAQTPVAKPAAKPTAVTSKVPASPKPAPVAKPAPAPVVEEPENKPEVAAPAVEEAAPVQEKVTVIEEKVEIEPTPTKPESAVSTQDKVAAIRARLAAMKKGN